MDIQQPKKGGMALSCASFLPKVLVKWKMMKINTANTMGKPSPPLRIMAPSGAPMKNMRMQENASTNLSFNAILCSLMFFCLYFKSISEPSIEKMVLSTLFSAVLMMDSFLLGSKFENTSVDLGLIFVFLETLKIPVRG